MRDSNLLKCIISGSNSSTAANNFASSSLVNSPVRCLLSFTSSDLGVLPKLEQPIKCLVEVFGSLLLLLSKQWGIEILVALLPCPISDMFCKHSYGP